MQTLDKRQTRSTWEKSGDLTQSLKEFLPSYKILRNGCQGETDDEHKEGSCVIWCKITCEQSQASSWKSPATPGQYHREQRHPIVGRPLQKSLEHILPSSRVHTFSFPTPCIKLPGINCQCDYSQRAPKPSLVPFSLPPGSCSSGCNWCLNWDPIHTLQAILKHFSLLKKKAPQTAASEPTQTRSELNNVSLS